MRPFIPFAISLLITLSLVGLSIVFGQYIPSDNTHWYEDSHLVCKERKGYGFGEKVEKTCYILEKIK